MTAPRPTKAAPTGRWTAKRKVELLNDIAAGDITRQGAFERFGVTEDELDSWTRRWAAFGAAGLATTRTQRLRA
jgi:hypothetical protein